jgi:hypothetical protein
MKMWSVDTSTGELRHGKEWDDHKYVAKEQIGRGKYRYFYTEKEHQAYLKSKNQNKLSLFDKAKSLVDKTVSSVKSTVSSTAKKVNNAVDKAIDKGKKFLDNAITDNPTVTFSDFSKDTKKGKSFIDKIITDNPTYSFTTISDNFSDKKNNDSIAKAKATARADAEKNVAKAKEGSYITSQNKERGLKREPELKEQLDKIGGKETLFKGTSWEFEYDKNPLPELNLKTKATTLDEDQATINPNYSSGSKWDENCAFCTMAYDLRRKGYDVVAKSENAGSVNVIDIADLYGKDLIGGVGLTEKYGYSKDHSGVTKAVEKEILSYGEGSYGFLNLHWSDGGGHATAWEVENGKVVVRDCQVNQKVELYDYISLSSNVFITRTDDAKPSKDVLKYVENRKR